MIIINGLKFAKNNNEFVETLFQREGTASGFYKKKKNGILFLDMQNNPIFFLCCNNPSLPFFVTCGTDTIISSGKKVIRYMHTTIAAHEKMLGLDKLSYRQQFEFCQTIKEI